MKSTKWAHDPNHNPFHPKLLEHGPASRIDDHETSVEAARETVARRGLRRRVLLRHFGASETGLADFELIAQLPEHHRGSVTKRRTDLYQSGCLERLDKTKETPHGSPAYVWRITSMGTQVALSLAPVG